MQRRLVRFLGLASSVYLVAAACGDATTEDGSTGGGTSTATGGAASSASGLGGGEANSGGAGGSGGAVAAGSSALGGAAEGGSTAAGGTSASGGAYPAGGAHLGVGSTAGGGGSASGGAPAGGGGSASSGAPGGGSANGGADAVGGTTGGAGAAPAGGASASGGADASGGSAVEGAGGSAVEGAGGVRWVGRVDAGEPESAQLAWQGAGLVATLSGDAVAVTLRTEGTGTVYFQPVINGVPGDRFNVDSGADHTITLATGLVPGEHQVELYRETEGYYGVSTFLGFASGTVLGAPASSGRSIEVIGDSISAGYGNLGVELHPNWVANPACGWTAENSSWYATYVAIAGRALGAEVSTIARSGWGMYRDISGSTSGVLSSVYDNTLGFAGGGAWSSPVQADAVVINLGTNDWATGDPGAAYEEAYVDFVATVRDHHPGAWIFLTIGPMLGDPELGQVKARLANVVAELTASGEERVSTFDFGTQNLGSDGSIPSGCDWHPSTTEHARMAEILEAELQEKLGW